MIFLSLFNLMGCEQFCAQLPQCETRTGQFPQAGMAQLQAGSLGFSAKSFDNALVARTKRLPIKLVVGEIITNVSRADLNLARAG